MLVKDFVIDSIYRGTNQKLQSVLLGRTAIVKAINFALSDIYTFEGKEWTFMYKKKVLIPGSKESKEEWQADSTERTIITTMAEPIKKILIIRNLEDININQDETIKIVNPHQPHTPPFPGPEWKILNTEPTLGIEDLRPQHLYFKPGNKELYLPNNRNKGYIIHWISFFNPIDWEDEIPLPDYFLGALYNLTLSYLYPINGQYGDNKDANGYNKAFTQLANLAKTDSFQLNAVYGNIH